MLTLRCKFATGDHDQLLSLYHCVVVVFIVVIIGVFGVFVVSVVVVVCALVLR